MKLKRYIALIPPSLLASTMLLLVACCSKECPQPPAPRPEAGTGVPATTNATEPTGGPSAHAALAVDTRLGAMENPRESLPESNLDVKRISRAVAYSLPLYHLNQLPMDAHIATNAFNQFIDSLDPARSYFLQSDIDTFAGPAETLNKTLRKGDISFAQHVFDVLLDRIENRLAFTNQLLDQGFDTELEETFVWDRKEAAWPKGDAEWDELWRKRIKNDYIARLVAQQVYPDVEDALTNTVDSAETSITNLVVDGPWEYDESMEDEKLTPEEFIRERYKQFKLTMDSFDEEMLLQRYLSSFSQVYDPHSDYMSPSSVEDFDINMKLSLVGIGAMLRPADGLAKIVRIIPGGPADKDGRLKAGDKIIAVAQGDAEPVSIRHWPLYKAVRLIRGEKDTKVVLSIIPASDRSGTRTKKIDLIRDEVKLEEQAAKAELKERDVEAEATRRLGVIILPDFYADFKATSKNEKDARRASTDVRRLINELMLEDIEGLILDLRNNGGGSLVEAIETAGLFISSGPIVQVKERGGVQVLPDADPEISYDGPLIVLVNRLSASASEILAAALQDYKRAIIIGDSQTHGKGTVQTLMPLGKRRGSLKLTTAGFYRINGGSTQLKGVTPDIILPSYLDVMDIGEDSLKHALPWDTIRPAMYRIQTGVSELIPVLAAQSRERLETNEEFLAFIEKRDRLKLRFETKTISLSLESRLAEAAAEKELDDIQSGAFLDDEDDEEETTDIILEEALNILSDMIDLKQANQSERLAPTMSSRAGSPAK